MGEGNIRSLGLHGAAPTAMDFLVDGCSVSDLSGGAIPETECVRSSVDILLGAAPLAVVGHRPT